MKLHEIDILIICAYLIAMIVIGLIPEETGCPKYGFLFPGREIIAILYARTLQCFRNV